MAAIAEGPHPFPSEHGSKVLQRSWRYYGARAHGKPGTPPAHLKSPKRVIKIVCDRYLDSPGSVAWPIIRDCHSRDSGSNPDQGASQKEYEGDAKMRQSKWARSSVWLEHRPFNSPFHCVTGRVERKPGVAGSNPVGPAS